MRTVETFGLVASFEAAHHLVGAGLCESPHGHTYRLEAQWSGPNDARVAAARRALDEAARSFDRRDLNQLMDYPSCENLCTHLARALEGAQAGLLKVRLHEGRSGWAEFTMEAS